MSDTPGLIGAPRQNARVRGLGDAVPVFTKPKGPREPDPTPKTSDGLRAEAQERRDAAPLTVRCGLCEAWSFEGTAGEGREAAKAHRLKEHPEVKPVKRKRDNLSALRPQNDAESRAEAMVKVMERRAFTARSEPPVTSTRKYQSPAQQSILRFLEDGPKRLSEIAAHQGTQMATNGKTLHTLATRGLIVKLGHGVYALPAEERAA